MHKEIVDVSIGTDRYSSHIRARGHGLVADEPTDLGGGDQGPTPYELLTGALGACTVITLRMYADRKEWPMEAVRVNLTHEKMQAEECDFDTELTGRIDVVTADVELVGPLTADQRARLMQIAHKCPVHKTLSGSVVIKMRETSRLP